VTEAPLLYDKDAVLKDGSPPPASREIALGRVVGIVADGERRPDLDDISPVGAKESTEPSPLEGAAGGGGDKPPNDTPPAPPTPGEPGEGSEEGNPSNQPFGVARFRDERPRPEEMPAIRRDYESRLQGVMERMQELDGVDYTDSPAPGFRAVALECEVPTSDDLAPARVMFDFDGTGTLVADFVTPDGAVARHVYTLDPRLADQDEVLGAEVDTMATTGLVEPGADDVTLMTTAGQHGVQETPNRRLARDLGTDFQPVAAPELDYVLDLLEAAEPTRWTLSDIHQKVSRNMGRTSEHEPTGEASLAAGDIVVQTVRGTLQQYEGDYDPVAMAPAVLVMEVANADETDMRVEVEENDRFAHVAITSTVPTDPSLIPRLDPELGPELTGGKTVIRLDYMVRPGDGLLIKSTTVLLDNKGRPTISGSSVVSGDTQDARLLRNFLRRPRHTRQPSDRQPTIAKTYYT